MTVCRDRNVCYGAGVREVRQAVLRVLQAGRWWYSYVDTVWNDQGSFIGVRIRPKWWTLLLSTEMQILLEESSRGCRVIVRTESQRFVFGDVFGFYRRFIEDFLAMLGAELER